MALRLPRDLDETTVLSLGDFGRYEGEVFELAGRRCVQGPRGQIWNEWTVHSKHDPPITLSESWGTFTMFRPGSLMPPLDQLLVGADLTFPWLITERGVATRLASYGEVDAADERYDYVDLSSRSSAQRASIAEGQTFLGDPVDLAALALAPRDDVPALIPAPNVSLPAGIDLWLDVGDVGTLEGVEYRVVGMAARASMPEAEEQLRWVDYLLYNTHVGLRWLSESGGHWSYVTPIDAGPITIDAAASFDNPVRLAWASGELPWSAEIGEVAFVSEQLDMVIERTFGDLSASRAIQLVPDDVARAFNKRSLPRPK